VATSLRAMGAMGVEEPHPLGAPPGRFGARDFPRDARVMGAPASARVRQRPPPPPPRPPPPLS